MKANTKALVAATRQVLDVATKRTTLPILNTFLVAATGNRLTITATDMEALGEISLECEGDLAPFCINAKLFSGLVQSGGESIEIVNEDKSLRITSGWSSKIPTLPAEEFPKSPLESMKGIGVSCADLAEGLSGVVWSTESAKDATTQSQFWRSGVSVKLQPKRMLCVAYNGPSCCVFDRALICAKFEGIIPGDHIKRMAEALKKPNATIASNENWIAVTHDGGTTACRMIEGETPDITGKMPKEQKPSLDFDRDVIVAHLEACNSVNSDQLDPRHGGQAYIEFGPEKTSLWTESASGASYRAELGATNGAAKFKVCFSIDRLLEGLKACTSDKIGWQQEDQMSPIRWRSGDFLSLLMPIRYGE